MKINIKKIHLGKNSKIALAVLAIILIIITVISAINNTRHNFFSTNSEYLCGIDVSQHNGEIEWDKVSKSADFAIIRVGYRGYGNGDVQADSRYKENLKGSIKNKMNVGVYFYTQAISIEEAEEEAEFVLGLIKPYNIDLPVFIDYEYPHDSNGYHTGRLYDASLSSKEASNIINAFCKKITDSGYSAGVYASSSVLNFNIKTSSLQKGLTIWVADYNSAVTYLGHYDVWQYSKTGSCDGVNSKYTDLNYWYIS